MIAARASLLSERQFHLVWRLGLHRRCGLLLEDGRSLDVLFPGHPASAGGPDFREARLRLAGVEVVGDVELHLQPSGWRRHGHGADSGYAGVILHVALHRDAFGDRGAPDPRAPGAELVLEPYLGLSVAELAAWTGGEDPGAGNPDRLLERLEALGRARFDRRRRAFLRRAASSGFEEALYRELMTALGYRLNKAPFAELARLIPRSVTRGLDRPALERRYGEAGRGLPWRVAGVRPANHPARRLSGWCALLPRVSGSLSVLDENAIVGGSGGRIGPDRASAMVASVLIPARGDWAGVVRMRPGPPDRAVLESAAALKLDPSRLSTMPLRWGALEWRRGLPSGPEEKISSRNRVAPA